MFHFERPEAYGNAKLFYKMNPVPDRTINPMSRETVVLQIRLYRWFLEEWERTQRQQAGKTHPNFSGLILKNDLISQIVCRNHPHFSKNHVGKILRIIVPYKVHFQRNPSKATDWENQTFWRWSHPLDIVYGLEFLMLSWLPGFIERDDGSCSTQEEFEEELEILRDQTPEEDIEFAKRVEKLSFSE